MKRRHLGLLLFFGVYLALVIGSLATGVGPGPQVGENFVSFFLQMMRILPFAFVLIGLFEVWVPDDFVERQLGEDSGVRGLIGAVILAGTTVGGVIVALPTAVALSRKGAGLSVVFTYLGAAAVCRIPMTIFEASFVGLRFTLIRYAVSLPLIALTAILLARFLRARGYELHDGEADPW